VPFRPIAHNAKDRVVRFDRRPCAQQYVQAHPFSEASNRQYNFPVTREAESPSCNLPIDRSEVLEIDPRPDYVHPSRQDTEILDQNTPECF
jgi:hypothetical protein